MEIAISIIIGICLSAASGFRIFVPFLIISAGSIFGYIDLGSGVEWMATYPALIAFLVATIVEIIGYYSPWVDNMLDLIATPLSIIAGAVLMSSIVVDINPFLKWTLSIIIGGGAAMNIQLLTVKARALSSLFTTGIGNPIISTIENFSSIVISILAVVIPAIALIVVLLITLLIYNKIIKKRKKEEESLSKM